MPSGIFTFTIDCSALPIYGARFQPSPSAAPNQSPMKIKEKCR